MKRDMSRVFCPVTDGRKEHQRAGSGAILFEYHLVCLYFTHSKEATCLLVQIGKGDLESLDKTIHCDLDIGYWVWIPVPMD